MITKYPPGVQDVERRNDADSHDARDPERDPADAVVKDRIALVVQLHLVDVGKPERHAHTAHTATRYTMVPANCWPVRMPARRPRQPMPTSVHVNTVDVRLPTATRSGVEFIL